MPRPLCEAALTKLPSALNAARPLCEVALSSASSVREGRLRRLVAESPVAAGAPIGELLAAVCVACWSCGCSGLTFASACRFSRSKSGSKPRLTPAPSKEELETLCPSCSSGSDAGSASGASSKSAPVLGTLSPAFVSEGSCASGTASLSPRSSKTAALLCCSSKTAFCKPFCEAALGLRKDRQAPAAKDLATLRLEGQTPLPHCAHSSLVGLM